MRAPGGGPAAAAAGDAAEGRVAVGHLSTAVTLSVLALVQAGQAHLGRAVQIAPMKPVSKAPGTQSLKLNYDDPLSIFAFEFNLRRYSSGGASPCSPVTSPGRAPARAPRAAAAAASGGKRLRRQATRAAANPS
jgi:hypothetical protein